MRKLLIALGALGAFVVMLLVPAGASSATTAPSDNVKTQFQHIRYEPAGKTLTAPAPPEVSGDHKVAYAGPTYTISSGLSKFNSRYAGSATSFYDRCTIPGCGWLAPKGGVQAYGFNVGPGHKTDQYWWDRQTSKWRYGRTVYGGPYGYWAEVFHDTDSNLLGVF